MKKILLVSMIFLFSGCLVRTYVVEKPRTNIEIRSDGNQGYLMGTPPATNYENKLGETRKVSTVEIELGSHKKYKRIESTEAENTYQEPVLSQANEVEAVELDKPEIAVEEPVAVQSSDNEYEVYTIQKNDTLQKISEKFYGTTKKWFKIYELNKDVFIKGPNKIYPGKEIKIPKL